MLLQTPAFGSRIALPNTPNTGLLYNATGDIATVPSFTVPTSEGSYALLFKVSSSTARQRFFGQFGTGVDTAIEFRDDIAGDPFNCWREGSVAYAGADANAANYAAFAYEIPLLLIFTWGAANSFAYMGNPVMPPAEPAAYNFQGAVDTPTSASGPLYLGNQSVGSSQYIRGTMYMAAAFSFQLDQLARYRLWRRIFLPNAMGFWVFGANGDRSVPDISGNGLHATTTSLTLVGGPPNTAGVAGLPAAVTC